MAWLGETRDDGVRQGTGRKVARAVWDKIFGKGKTLVGFLVGTIFAAGVSWGIQTTQIAETVRGINLLTPAVAQTAKDVEGLKERVSGVERAVLDHVARSPEADKSLAGLVASFEVFSKAVENRLTRIENKIDSGLR